MQDRIKCRVVPTKNWRLIKRYETFSLYERVTRSGQKRRECFYHEQNPNEMVLSIEHGVMRQPWVRDVQI